MTKLIYIGGYGRSGSTLLERFLAASPDAVACGEVSMCRHKWAAKNCSCGTPCEDCSVWGSFFRSDAGMRGWTHNALTLALVDQAPGDDAIVIDSSKTAWGSASAPFKFRQELGKDFHLLHVVRDPRGVCWSNVSSNLRKNGKRLPDIRWAPHRIVRHLRTILGWWAANLSCELFGLLHRDRYLRIRYEDLAGSPAETFDQMFETLEPGHSYKLADINAHDNRHQLFGNRVRYQKISPSEIHKDIRWQTEMPSGQRHLISLLSWPLRLRYGY